MARKLLVLQIAMLLIGVPWAEGGQATNQAPAVSAQEAQAGAAGVAQQQKAGRRVIGDGVIDSPLELHHAHKEGQHGPLTGHLPASSANVELVGKLRVHDAAPGVIADVGTLGKFAYLARFSPGCKGGVYVIDISNPSAPAEVGFIPAHAGSFVGEGVQVLRINTAFFQGDILVHNNEICDAATGLGGMSIWDVTNPLDPKPLALNVGDDDGGTSPVNQIHSVFAWQQGARAYAVLIDDEELLDVDIFDITDPRHPVMIAETGLPDWPQAQTPLANGTITFFHDGVVKNINGHWRMLLNYWDAGVIILDVDDPANPKFIDDSNYPDPDPLTGFSPPEGNAHQAEWDKHGRFIIYGDEDFSPFRLRFAITTGPSAGPYPGGEFGFARSISTLLPDRKLNGPTVFGGYGCNDDVASIPPPSVLGPLAPGEEKIVVFSRGPVQDPNHPHGACRFDEKIQNAKNAGYETAVIANHHIGAGAGDNPDAALCGGGDPRDIFAICIGHRAFHLLFNRTPDYTVPYPVGDPGDLEPNIGDLGAKIEAEAQFDGWGYVHLLDANTLEEIDAYAIPEALDERFATGFGALTVHEVATDPAVDLAYLSYYNAGFRVLAFGPEGLKEVGHFIDEGGNNFWGVQVAQGNGQLILASDRDFGLYIFRYTGPQPQQALRSAP